MRHKKIIFLSIGSLFVLPAHAMLNAATPSAGNFYQHKEPHGCQRYLKYILAALDEERARAKPLLTQKDYEIAELKRRITSRKNTIETLKFNIKLRKENLENLRKRRPYDTAAYKTIIYVAEPPRLLESKLEGYKWPPKYEEANEWILSLFD